MQLKEQLKKQLKVPVPVPAGQSLARQHGASTA